MRPLGVLKRGLAVVVGTLVALLLAEQAARAVDSNGISYYRDLGRYWSEAIALPPDAAHPAGRLFEHQRRMDLPLINFDLVTNELGLRTESADDAFEVDRSADDGHLRILFLGDSVTFAWGVDDAESWPRRIEREARAPDGRPLECINAGHPHYDTVQELDWLRTYGDRLKPDLVVLTYVVNDVDSSWALFQEIMNGLAERTAEQATFGGGLKAKLQERFWALRGLFQFKELQAEAIDVAASAGDTRESATYAEGWKTSAGALAGIQAFCAERGIPWIVLDHSLPELPEVAAWCAQAKVPFGDLRFYPADFERGVTNSKADSHANALGNALLAERARGYLRSAGWLAPSD